MSPSSSHRKIIFSTERLYGYEMQVDDAENWYNLNSDPEVLRYTGDPPFKSVKAAEEFIKNYDAFEKSGVGRWSLRLKENDEFIGWCGLKRHNNGEIDLGFRLMSKHWNKGYSTEAAKECIKYGFEHFDDDYLIGRAMHDNKASIRVLEKVGMKYWKEVEEDLHDAVCYRIDRSDYLNQRTD